MLAQQEPQSIEHRCAARVIRLQILSMAATHLLSANARDMVFFFNHSVIGLKPNRPLSFPDSGPRMKSGESDAGRMII